MLVPTLQKNHLGNLSAPFVGRALDQMGQKMMIFGQKCQFWAKFGRFLAKKTIFWAVGVKLLVPSYNHLGVPNNVQPSLGNIEPVLGVHATKRQKIPYLGTMPFCEFKMAKTAFLSTCLIFATVQAH